MIDTKLTNLMTAFKDAGQGHVFEHWSTLNGPEKKELFSQAQAIDLSVIKALFEKSQQGEQELDLSQVEPAPYIPLPTSENEQATHHNARTTGEQALRNGKVAAFTVAGGSGSRLGHPGPKGTFPVTPLTEKSLFQVFAEKIIKTGQVYGQQPHWFIMTSEANDQETQDFFKEHNHFGLDQSKLHFFTQGTMPAIDKDTGKILMEEKGKISTNADGHGGSLKAMVQSGAIQTMEKEGIEHVSYMHVDNPMINIFDPTFIGFHLQDDSDISCKMLPKASAEEKVGNFCVINGDTQVIEYTDLPKTQAAETNPDGELRFKAGSVGIQLFKRAFIEKVGSAKNASFTLPFHIAVKKIAFIGANGQKISPQEPNGIKPETFVFDAMPFAEKVTILEGERDQEFSPVKNAEGNDSPLTSQIDQTQMWIGWMENAGVKLDGLATNPKTNLPALEISPLFATSAIMFANEWEALEEKPEITGQLVLAPIP